MGKFWVQDDFIRKYAKGLSVYAQVVFVNLACHVDKNGETFVGYRKIAEELGINKNTVTRAIKELKGYGLVRHLGHKRGKVSRIKINPVPLESDQVSQIVGHKEEFEEVFKENPKAIIKRSNPEAYKKIYGDQSDVR